jgi:uncharacterized protein (DUF362 family)
VDSLPSRVATVVARDLAYPVTAPFHPSYSYPELARFSGVPRATVPNGVYDAVRTALAALGLDHRNRDTAEWNPLRDVVRPGDHVLVKPNWVVEGHHDDGSWEQIITHGSVLRATIDYVALALAGRGRITLADGPMLHADIGAVCERSGIPALIEHYRRAVPEVELEVVDLRSLCFTVKDDVIVRRTRLTGDPRGAVRVNLGKSSEFFGFPGEGRYYGADYDTREVNLHHRGDIQEYLLSGTALSADVIIDVPKLKTHQKAGMTLCLKGIVGLNSGRNWLPHRTQGTPREGGDQFEQSTLVQRLEGRLVRAFEVASLAAPALVSPIHRVAKRVGKKVFGTTDVTVRGGGWYGNDTLWRMTLDINRALTFADARGALHDTPVRRRFSVIDGVIAGEGEGPVYATPVSMGAIVAGANPVAVDVVATELAGFDFTKIPTLANAVQPHPLPLWEQPIEDIALVGGPWASLSALRAADPLRLRSPRSWAGRIERGRDPR